MNAALEEITGLVTGWRIWLTLAWNDIKLRYRRSSLGPLWLTISMAIRIYFMGFLYAHLFKVDINVYFPFLASGIIIWTTISTLLNEATIAFIESENYIRNIKILFSHFAMRIVARNIIILAHNLLAYLPIILFFSVNDPNFKVMNLLLFIPNLFIITLCAFLWAFIFAMGGARFRDMTLIIDSIMQVVFFMTPIMWMPSLLPENYQLLVQLNPFYHVMNLIRDPLLGHDVHLISYEVIFSFIAVGFATFYYLLNKNKYKIIFWL